MPQPLPAEPWDYEAPPEGRPEPPPTQDELPCDDGEPIQTQRHKWQMDLLICPLDRWLEVRGEGYVNGNMFVYFSLEQTRGAYFRGPDVFVVLGVPRGERKAWVVWEQGKAPDLVIELLSDTTRAHDKGEKMRVYQDQMRVPEYCWYDPFNPSDLAAFRLMDGRYQPLGPGADGRLTSSILGLCLVHWEGVFNGLPGSWLRWATPDGVPLPTEGEAERERAERAEAELAALRAALDGGAGTSGR